LRQDPAGPGEVLDAAMAEFAAHRYEGSSTEEIARRAGISQPYVFRLFGTKKNLFKAAVKRCLSELRFRVTCSRQFGSGYGFP
jgi:AcrR family transcriptional regulator